MRLASTLVSFLNVLVAAAATALFILPISILLFIILRRAWREGRALYDAAPVRAQAFLFLPTWMTVALILVAAPSVCPTAACAPPPYRFHLLAFGALAVVGATILVARRHPLRTVPEGRELVTATLVAEAYYALVAGVVADGMMRGQFAPL